MSDPKDELRWVVKIVIAGHTLSTDESLDHSQAEDVCERLKLLGVSTAEVVDGWDEAFT